MSNEIQKEICKKCGQFIFEVGYIGDTDEPYAIIFHCEICDEDTLKISKRDLTVYTSSDYTLNKDRKIKVRFTEDSLYETRKL